MTTNDIRDLKPRIGDCMSCYDGVCIMTGNDPPNVERCDDCAVYESDAEAAIALDRFVHATIRSQNP